MLLQVIGDGEAFDFGGESHGVQLRIEIAESLNPADTASSLPHVVPEGINASTEWRDSPQPRNDDVTAMLFHQSDPLLMRILHGPGLVPIEQLSDVGGEWPIYAQSVDFSDSKKDLLKAARLI
jgi:hypothetical protein